MCGDVKGLIVHDIEFKISQYPGDTILLSQEDLNSVMKVLKFKKLFQNVSRLENNKDKTWEIGESRGRSIPWQGKFCFKWATTFKMLGRYYHIN